MTNIHPDHFLYGTGNLLLDITADLANVDVLFKREEHIYENCIIYRLNPNPIACAAPKESIYAPRNRCHSADAGHTQGGETRDRNEHIR
jgi:hypothetical protein